jgi:hypothetical protein
MKTVKLFLIMSALAILQGCVHASLDTRTDRGVGLEVGVGVDDPRYADEGYGEGRGRGGPGQGGDPRGAPCARTLGAMMASEPLIAWASRDGSGMEHRSANARAYESGGMAGYSCNAANIGASSTEGGEAIRPRSSFGGGYRDNNYGGGYDEYQYRRR